MVSFKNDKRAKRYYWLQLKTDFFDQKEIKLLRKIAGGDTFTVIYLKMLLASLKDDGKLYFESIGDDFIEEVALLIDEDVENVSLTISFLQNKGLIDIIEKDEYFLNRVPEMVGSEAFSTERSRRHRANKKQELLQSNAEPLQTNNAETVVQQHATKRRDIDREELEKDIDIKKNKQSSSKLDKELLQSNFNRLWDMYPRKQGKTNAFKAYEKSIKEGATDEEIEKGIEAYKKQIEIQRTELQFIKQGSTWFNQKCWNDEYITEGSQMGYNNGWDEQAYEDSFKIEQPSSIATLPEINIDDLPF